MPKDEFDFEDPLELNGVALLSEEDTADMMTECFIEEFMRLGYNHKQLLALFRNRHYLGMNMVLQTHGEEFVRNKISEGFIKRGRQLDWSDVSSSRHDDAPANQSEIRDLKINPDQSQSLEGDTTEFDSGATDPMGASIPKLELGARVSAVTI